jgi:hypothetical protein
MCAWGSAPFSGQSVFITVEKTVIIVLASSNSSGFNLGAWGLDLLG